MRYRGAWNVIKLIQDSKGALPDARLQFAGAACRKSDISQPNSRDRGSRIYAHESMGSCTAISRPHENPHELVRSANPLLLILAPVVAPMCRLGFVDLAEMRTRMNLCHEWIHAYSSWHLSSIHCTGSGMRCWRRCWRRRRGTPPAPLRRWTRAPPSASTRAATTRTRCAFTPAKHLPLRRRQQ